MAYPATSDWASAQPVSAWFVHRAPGAVARVCATTGWDFARDLQEYLRTRLEDAGGSLPGPDGAVRAGDVAVDPAVPVYPGTLRALWAVANRDGAPAAYLDAVATALRARAWNREALQTALWATYLSAGYRGDEQVYGLGHPDEAGLPPMLALPPAASAPPRPVAAGSQGSSSGLNCVARPEAERDVVAPVVGPLKPYNVWPAIAVVAAGFVAVSLASALLPRTLKGREKRKS